MSCSQASFGRFRSEARALREKERAARDYTHLYGELHVSNLNDPQHLDAEMLSEAEAHIHPSASQNNLAAADVSSSCVAYSPLNASTVSPPESEHDFGCMFRWNAVMRFDVLWGR